MDGCTGETNSNQGNGSFGIKKIVDVKLREDGKQMYKVQWEPTWEPVENLVTCQHLIDDFWCFVNKAKVSERNAQQFFPHFNMNLNMNHEIDFPKMPEDDKSEVQRLIARTNSTLVPPNAMLNQHNHQMANIHSNFQDSLLSSPSSKSKLTASPKTELSSPGGKEKVTISSLKSIENFENPYVKIILVCKICNKEQSLKLARNWKRHYLSHATNEEKPHQCPYCPKAFITLTQKNKHLRTHEKAAMQQNQQNVKQEQDMFHMQQLQQHVKVENMYPMYPMY